MDMTIAKREPNLLEINASISHLAFLNIFTKYEILAYEFKPLNEFYFTSPAANELCNSLKRISMDLTKPELMPLARLFQVKLIISTFNVTNWINRLTNETLEELKLFGKQLATQTDAKPVIPTIPDNFPAQISSSEVTTTLEVDSTFENKILLNYLIANSPAPLSTLIEKVELMTMEPKEKLLEQILCSSESILLPKAIMHQPFYHLQLIEPLGILHDLIKCPQIRLTFTPFTINQGVATDNEIATTASYEAYLTVLELVKRHFRETSDPYVIPLNFNQSALLAVDLHAIQILKKHQSPFIHKLLNQVKLAAPFLKNYLL